MRRNLKKVRLRNETEGIVGISLLSTFARKKKKYLYETKTGLVQIIVISNAMDVIFYKS